MLMTNLVCSQSYIAFCLCHETVLAGGVCSAQQLALLSGKMPEEAKEVQMSGQQTDPAARSKPGAESKGEDKPKHKMSEKL